MTQQGFFDTQREIFDRQFVIKIPQPIIPMRINYNPLFDALLSDTDSQGDYIPDRLKIVKDYVEFWSPETRFLFINDALDSGYSVFHRGLQGGRVDIISYLIENGGDVNTKMPYTNLTPLEFLESINHENSMDDAIMLLNSILQEDFSTKDITEELAALGVNSDDNPIGLE